MKKTVILTIQMLVLVLAGCAIDPASTEQPTKEPASATIEPEVIALIEELGYKTDGIRMSGDNYIVEGDAEIPKSYLEELKTEPQTRAKSKDRYGEGGTLIGPNLEIGNVLHTNKSYTFQYDPYRRIPENSYQIPRLQMVDIAVDGDRCEGKVFGRVSIQHTFTKPGSYEAKGRVVYFVEYSKPSFIPNGSNWNETYYRSRIYEVVDPLAIVGSETVDWNINATFGTTILMEGATFDGWSISPNSYSTTGGLNNRDLTVKFTDCLNYTLTANFTKPDGMTYIAKKQISVVPTKPEITVSASKLSEQEVVTAGFGRGSTVYWVSTMPTVEIGVSPSIPSATYKWRSGDGYLFNPREGRRITLDMPSLRPPYNHHNRYGINCVVYANGQYSQEVTVYLFASRLRPGTPGWDSRALEIDEDEDDSKTDESVEVIEDVLAE